MRQFQLTALAEKDLEDIYDHIAENNPEAAYRMIQAIETRLDAIVAMPNVGKKRDEFFKGIRSLAEGNYVIFYKNITAGILIVRVVHSKRDLNQFFEPEAMPPEIGNQ